MSVNTYFYLIRDNVQTDVSDTIFCGIGNLNRSGWGYYCNEVLTKKGLLQFLPAWRLNVIENYDGDSSMFPEETLVKIVENVKKEILDISTTLFKLDGTYCGMLAFKKPYQQLLTY